MSQMGFSQARTGRRSRRGGFGEGVQNFGFTEGKQHRIFIPTRLGEDGKPQIVVFGQTVHQVKSGVIFIPRSGGKKPYQSHTFRCSHPYSQQNHEDAVTVAEREEMCPLCELERLQNQQRLNIMDEEIGFDEFKKLSKKEKKAFYDEHPLSVEQSYYKKEVDGEEVTVLHREMYILAIEVELEEKKKTVRNKKTGRERTTTDYIPLVKDGKVQYKPVLQKVSGARLEAYKDAVDNAIQNDILDYDYTHPIIENEGTDFEEEVNIAWVDIQLNFPDKNGDRMASGREVNITATPTDKSVIVEYPELKKEIENKMDKIYEDAHSMFNRMYKHLSLYPREDVLDMFGKDIREEFEQLRDELRTEDDEEWEQKVYASVLEDTLEDDSEDEEESEEVGEEEEVEEKPKKKASTKKKTTKKKTSSKAGATKKKKTAKKKEEVEEDEEDLDDDIDFDEDDLLG